MADPAGPFWTNVNRFRELGLDPLKWIAGCSVEVEREEVLYPAVERAGPLLNRLGVTVLPQEGPDAVELRGEPVRLDRFVVRPGRGPLAGREAPRANPNRAVLTMRVAQKRASNPELLAPLLVTSVAGLPQAAPPGPARAHLERPLIVARLHAVVTPQPDAEFALFDLCDTGSGQARGYSLLHNETLEITDPTFEPTSEVHTSAAATAALNALFAAGACENTALHPMLAAPDPRMLAQLEKNLNEFARRFHCRVEAAAPLPSGPLFIGATATASTPSEIPNRHHYVQKGMEILLTRPFGDLAPLATYLSCLADPDYLARLESGGLRLADLARAKEDTVLALTTPAREVGEVIRDFCPPFQDPPELSIHLAAAVDLSGRGVFALRDLAERWNVELTLRDLPLSHPEIAAFATEAFLMDNATASATGAVALVGFPRVIDRVEAALRSKGLAPHRVGEVTGAGEPALRVPASARQAVASKRLLRQLVIADAAPA